MVLMFILSLFLILILFGYSWYVSIIRKRNKAREALSTIDVHLTKRSDLIPSVLKIAQKYMQFEKSLMMEITELRSQAQQHHARNTQVDVQNYFATAEELAAKLGQLMVAVENYPDLKSDQAMLQAQQTYTEVEAQIAAARRFYNSAVTELNNAIEIFPGKLIAPYANAETMLFYQTDSAAKAAIDVDNYFN